MVEGRLIFVPGDRRLIFDLRASQAPPDTHSRTSVEADIVIRNICQRAVVVHVGHNRPGTIMLSTRKLRIGAYQEGVINVGIEDKEIRRLIDDSTTISSFSTLRTALEGPDGPQIFVESTEPGFHSGKGWQQAHVEVFKVRYIFPPDIAGLSKSTRRTEMTSQTGTFLGTTSRHKRIIEGGVYIPVSPESKVAFDHQMTAELGQLEDMVRTSQDDFDRFIRAAEELSMKMTPLTPPSSSSRGQREYSMMMLFVYLSALTRARAKLEEGWKAGDGPRMSQVANHSSDDTVPLAILLSALDALTILEQPQDYPRGDLILANLEALAQEDDRGGLEYICFPPGSANIIEWSEFFARLLDAKLVVSIDATDQKQLRFFINPISRFKSHEVTSRGSLQAALARIHLMRKQKFGILSPTACVALVPAAKYIARFDMDTLALAKTLMISQGQAYAIPQPDDDSQLISFDVYSIVQPLVPALEKRTLEGFFMSAAERFPPSLLSHSRSRSSPNAKWSPSQGINFLASEESLTYSADVAEMDDNRGSHSGDDGCVGEDGDMPLLTWKGAVDSWMIAVSFADERAKRRALVFLKVLIKTRRLIVRVTLRRVALRRGLTRLRAHVRERVCTRLRRRVVGRRVLERWRAYLHDAPIVPLQRGIVGWCLLRWVAGTVGRDPPLYCPPSLKNVTEAYNEESPRPGLQMHSEHMLSYPSAGLHTELPHAPAVVMRILERRGRGYVSGRFHQRPTRVALYAHALGLIDGYLARCVFSSWRRWTADLVTVRTWILHRVILRLLCRWHERAHFWQMRCERLTNPLWRLYVADGRAAHFVTLHRCILRLQQRTPTYHRKGRALSSDFIPEAMGYATLRHASRQGGTLFALSRLVSSLKRLLVQARRRLCAKRHTLHGANFRHGRLLRLALRHMFSRLMRRLQRRRAKWPPRPWRSRRLSVALRRWVSNARRLHLLRRAANATRGLYWTSLQRGIFIKWTHKWKGAQACRDRIIALQRRYAILTQATMVNRLGRCFLHWMRHAAAGVRYRRLLHARAQMEQSALFAASKAATQRWALESQRIRSAILVQRHARGFLARRSGSCREVHRLLGANRRYPSVLARWQQRSLARCWYEWMSLHRAEVACSARSARETTLLAAMHRWRRRVSIQSSMSTQEERHSKAWGFMSRSVPPHKLCESWAEGVDESASRYNAVPALLARRAILRWKRWTTLEHIKHDALNTASRRRDLDLDERERERELREHATLLLETKSPPHQQQRQPVPRFLPVPESEPRSHAGGDRTSLPQTKRSTMRHRARISRRSPHGKMLRSEIPSLRKSKGRGGGSDDHGDSDAQDNFVLTPKRSKNESEEEEEEEETEAKGSWLSPSHLALPTPPRQLPHPPDLHHGRRRQGHASGAAQNATVLPDMDEAWFPHADALYERTLVLRHLRIWSHRCRAQNQQAQLLTLVQEGWHEQGLAQKIRQQRGTGSRATDIALRVIAQHEKRTRWVLLCMWKRTKRNEKLRSFRDMADAARDARMKSDAWNVLSCRHARRKHMRAVTLGFWAYVSRSKVMHVLQLRVRRVHPRMRGDRHWYYASTARVLSRLHRFAHLRRTDHREEAIALSAGPMRARVKTAMRTLLSAAEARQHHQHIGERAEARVMLLRAGLVLGRLIRRKLMRHRAELAFGRADDLLMAHGMHRLMILRCRRRKMKGFGFVTLFWHNATVSAIRHLGDLVRRHNHQRRAAWLGTKHFTSRRSLQAVYALERRRNTRAHIGRCVEHGDRIYRRHLLKLGMCVMGARRIAQKQLRGMVRRLTLRPRFSLWLVMCSDKHRWSIVLREHGENRRMHIMHAVLQGWSRIAKRRAYCTSMDMQLRSSQRKKKLTQLLTAWHVLFRKTRNERLTLAVRESMTHSLKYRVLYHWIHHLHGTQDGRRSTKRLALRRWHLCLHKRCRDTVRLHLGAMHHRLRQMSVGMLFFIHCRIGYRRHRRLLADRQYKVLHGALWSLLKHARSSMAARGTLVATQKHYMKVTTRRLLTQWRHRAKVLMAEHSCGMANGESMAIRTIQKTLFDQKCRDIENVRHHNLHRILVIWSSDCKRQNFWRLRMTQFRWRRFTYFRQRTRVKVVAKLSAFGHMFRQYRFVHILKQLRLLRIARQAAIEYREHWAMKRHYDLWCRVYAARMAQYQALVGSPIYRAMMMVMERCSTKVRLALYDWRVRTRQAPRILKIWLMSKVMVRWNALATSKARCTLRLKRDTLAAWVLYKKGKQLWRRLLCRRWFNAWTLLPRCTEAGRLLFLATKKMMLVFEQWHKRFDYMLLRHGFTAFRRLPLLRPDFNREEYLRKCEARLTRCRFATSHVADDDLARWFPADYRSQKAALAVSLAEEDKGHMSSHARRRARHMATFTATLPTALHHAHTHSHTRTQTLLDIEHSVGLRQSHLRDGMTSSPSPFQSSLQSRGASPLRASHLSGHSSFQGTTTSPALSSSATPRYDQGAVGLVASHATGSPSFSSSIFPRNDNDAFQRKWRDTISSMREKCRFMGAYTPHHGSPGGVEVLSSPSTSGHPTREIPQTPVTLI